MDRKDCNELLLEQLWETLSAERAILADLPRLATGAAAGDQARQLENYLQRTSERIRRLEHIPDLGAAPPSAVKPAIASVLAEFDVLFYRAEGSQIREAAVASVLQAVRHFLIARYAALTAWAMVLHKADLAKLLITTLDEERAEVQRSGGAASSRGEKDRPRDMSMGERLTALFDRRK
jgi:ferritin-like metal-binding protein YciE